MERLDALASPLARTFYLNGERRFCACCGEETRTLMFPVAISLDWNGNRLPPEPWPALRPTKQPSLRVRPYA